MKLQTTNYKPLTHQRGFTLIEAIVATSVFAFMVSSTVGVYLSVLKLDRKTRAQRAVYENARFIMEFVGKEVRNGTIEYPSYPSGNALGRTDLYVTNIDGVLEHFSFDGAGNLILEKAGLGPTNLNSVKVKLGANSKFLIKPDVDPYTPAKTTNEQPHVTVILQLTSNYGVNPADAASINLQSTYATRTYTNR